MLQAIHDRATGVIAWIIVFLISIPFALWGVNSYFEGGADLQVAIVNDTEINQREFENVYRNQRQRLVERLGAGVANSLDEKALKEALLDRFIAEELMTQVIADQSMRASDAQVMARITSDPSFQVDGRYDPERYKTLLRFNGQSPVGYEENMRSGIVMSQLTDGLTGTALALRGETNRLGALRGQTRSVEMVAFKPKDYERPDVVTDDQISAHYESHKSEFKAPEQVRVAYLELSARALESRVEVNEEALKAWYEEHQDQYLTPEGRETRHILFEVPAGDKAAESAARAEAEAVLAKLKAGESFEELAKAHSDDPGSASEGGSLGPVERGMMVPEFELALFDLEEGQLSDIVKTDFGWHIIKLDRIIAPQGKSFAEVRAEAELQYRRQQAEDRYFTLSELLSDRSYEVPDSLEVAAEAVDLTVAESGLFSREGGSGIAAHLAVVEAAFSEDVMNEGNNSAPVEVGDNHIVVLRIAERVPERALALDEVKEQIRQTLIGDAAAAKAKQLAGEALDKINGGTTPTNAASAIKGEHIQYEKLARFDRSQDQELRTTAFKLPEKGAGLVTLADGTVAALKVVSITNGAGEETDVRAQQRASITNGQREYEALVERLKADASVQIFKDNL